MKSKLIKSAFVAAIAIMAGVNVFKAQKDVDLSDIAKENVEALANNELGPDRPDCEPYENEICKMLVIYPNGITGEENLREHKKKPGWI